MIKEFHKVLNLIFLIHKAFTTTIPAQFVKKFKCKIVPIYIERVSNVNFKLTIHEPLEYYMRRAIESITLDKGAAQKIYFEEPRTMDLVS